MHGAMVPSVVNATVRAAPFTACSRWRRKLAALHSTRPRSRTHVEEDGRKRPASEPWAEALPLGGGVPKGAPLRGAL